MKMIKYFLEANEILMVIMFEKKALKGVSD